MVDDEHQRRQAKQLVSEAQCIIAATDSGAKQDKEWAPQVVSFYLQSDDCVLRLLVSVPSVTATTGEQLAAAEAAAWRDAGIDKAKQTAEMSDTCSTMTGKQKGAIQLVRQSSDNLTISAANCLDHVIDLALRSGLQAMSGLSGQW
jgi:hypothetical protein